jgi:hypothetical protein
VRGYYGCRPESVSLSPGLYHAYERNAIAAGSWLSLLSSSLEKLPSRRRTTPRGVARCTGGAPPGRERSRLASRGRLSCSQLDVCLRPTC